MAKAKQKNTQELTELAEEIAVQAAAEDIDADTEASEEDGTEETVETDATSAADAQDSDGEEKEMPAITQDDLRLVEAILFASASALSVQQIAERFPEGRAMLIPDVLEMLKEHYAARGVTLVQRDRKWALRTATDLGAQMRLEKEQPKKFTRAAMETLAIIAYHQPVTRAEIENIRGVATSPGALDTLMEAGWIKPGKRREVPGRPVTWLSTQSFLDHFGLEKLEDLPGMDDLKAAGLLDKRPAIEAMPTADLFGDGEDKEDIDPNEVTDEDLLGKPDSADDAADEDDEDTVMTSGGDDDEDADEDDADESDDDDDDSDEDDEDDSDREDYDIGVEEDDEDGDTDDDDDDDDSEDDDFDDEDDVEDEDEEQK